MTKRTVVTYQIEEIIKKAEEWVLEQGKDIGDTIPPQDLRRMAGIALWAKVAGGGVTYQPAFGAIENTYAIGWRDAVTEAARRCGDGHFEVTKRGMIPLLTYVCSSGSYYIATSGGMPPIWAAGIIQEGIHRASRLVRHPEVPIAAKTTYEQWDELDKLWVRMHGKREGPVPISEEDAAWLAQHEWPYSATETPPT